MIVDERKFMFYQFQSLNMCQHSSTKAEVLFIIISVSTYNIKNLLDKFQELKSFQFKAQSLRCLAIEDNFFLKFRQC